MRILLTGFTGFIGRNLCNKLSETGHEVVCVGRKGGRISDGFSYSKVDSIDADTDWESSLFGVDVVIHLAALAHKGTNSWQDYYSINLGGAVNLARQFSKVCGGRFIFLSSIGVNGAESDSAFTYLDSPSPKGYYSKSKHLAELALQEIAMKTDVELVIIRPPLVYGPGAPGNFGSLVRWIEKGIPLPLGAIHNKRSLVGIDNLVDLIIRCIDHPAAANQVFLAGDGEDLSTTELLRGVGKAMGKPARLIPVPAGLLQFGATLLGKKAMAQRLLGSLQVDISKTCELLDWKPPYTVEEGLRRCFKRSN
ncbi:UDP-glucose 4-epimerase family protein [Ectopseudomonas toyotomiensis]|uniref:SDR family oxidoreductase n=1 Tax=Ectopseudomonas toyotomiensis TaxID=554344 RepID=A0AA42IPI3_9GAMM|nr:SDR family oxidoreductase [Pseudomonas toyotomiensis]MBG0843057.1 SDR family oxidoreductase [Pseudomonas toyotomiensis]MDH0703138.1 SDR family oxidoreductase [Pseudomonas toyotomiensis]